MRSSHTTHLLRHWYSRIAGALDPRSAPRFARLLLAAAFARGRRTVANWIRGAGLAREYRRAYAALAAAGRRADAGAARLAIDAVKPLFAGASRLTLALDDTPTERYGPKVQGAGVHHNPSPGTAGSAFLYGHVWVVLGVLACHPVWGTLALPLLARLYVRQKDLPRVPASQRPAFRTKLELAVELMRWAVARLGHWGGRLWLVTDGAYAKKPVLKPAKDLGVTVVSRLRRDAALCSVPGPRRPGQRGRPRIYGDRRIDLAKRAAHRGGWSEGTFALYGREVAKRYKTFQATWRPAGGLIRVVLVGEPTGWVAFFCTDPDATAADVLTTVAARFSLETAFRDLKQEQGAGQQQVRRLDANVGAFHTCLWSHTATEAWAWSRSAEELAGHRLASPWDDPWRRPSHADKRRALRREHLGEEIRAALRAAPSEAEIPAAAERLLDLAA